MLGFDNHGNLSFVAILESMRALGRLEESKALPRSQIFLFLNGNSWFKSHTLSQTISDPALLFCHGGPFKN